MDRDAPNQRPSRSGMRRRHSVPVVDDNSTDDAQSSHDTHATTRSSDGRAGSTPTAAASLQQNQTSSLRRSLDLGHRVRFSSEAERQEEHADEGSPSEAAARNGGGGGGIKARPGVPPLSIDTSKTSPSTALGRGIVQSPSAARSPDHATSPRARGRGMSLRRTVFSRGMHHQYDGASTIIEMDAVGSSTTSPAYRDTPPHDNGRSTSESVTGAPMQDDYAARPPPPLLDQKKSTITGISALPNYEALVRARAAQHAYRRKIKAAYERARKFILRIREIPPSKTGRHIDIDACRTTPLIDERTRQPYISNLIRSSKYSAWNFLPRQLFAQFSKLANFYFLCVSILQMIPGLSTTGTYTTIVPLLFFVSISIGREGYDDIRRSRLDKEENNREALVLHASKQTDAAELPKDSQSSQSSGPKDWATTKWKSVKVGDIVKLERDQAAPADLVLLHSRGENGVAYVETMALDGETNLKSKQALLPLSEISEDVDGLAGAAAHLVVEDPNLDLYNFDGKVTVGGETLPLTNNEIIYRGSILRNTPEALGVVIYSGEECKIRMNANKNPRIKAPTLQSLVNKVVFIIVAFVIALASFNTIAYSIWEEEFEDQAWYLTSAGVRMIDIFLSFVIMFNTMIPLSLYVSLEIIKICQMVLLNDIDMYDEASDTPMEARTATINEELGQVSYIFSDKTGTLTDNSMKFRKMSVAGTAWIHDADLKAAALKDAKNPHLTHKKRGKGKRPVRERLSLKSFEGRHPIRGSMSVHSRSANSPACDMEPASQWRSSAKPTKVQHELPSAELIRFIQRKPNAKFSQKARLFLLSIALCHTCLPETKEDGTINFQAASPDELALVQAAEELGYIMVDRRSGKITIKTFPRGPETEPRLEVFEVLDVVEFSSKRKRMSVVVRFPDGHICVICKGADSAITPLLRLSAIAIQKSNEIEQRAHRRRSIEAQQAIARKSDQLASPTGNGRPSFSLEQRRFSFGRPSISNSRKHSLRDHVGAWLAERERDVDAPIAEDASVYYSPRRSSQIGRPSATLSDARSFSQDSYIVDLVDDSLVADEPAVIERCFQHITDFATDGLRTLLYGYRFLSEDEYSKWKSEYNEAKTSLVDRQAKIERTGELIERDFELGGATAIEDKLQKGVPEAIDKLRRANIKMWMLTGDKRETAINIGHSCRLIKDYSSITVLDRESGEVEQHLAAALVDIGAGNVAHSVIVIDGQTLAAVVGDESIKHLFFDLVIQADSVICCRASPAQKAFLIKTIRQKVKKSVTLAIGDGANDIAMIQEAHVGIGITGKEGLQAARTSDYSIAQFRFLTKLLLVHGRWNYIRTCKYTVGTFWKEMTFYLTQALYQRWVGYTGTSLYESWSLSMFNTLFTSLPVIFLGVFSKDLSASTLLAVPELYTKGQRSGGFNFKIYLSWMFLAASESVTVFFSMYSLFGVGAADSASPDIYPMGVLSFTAIVLLISFKLQLLEPHNIAITNAIAVLLSCGGWFVFNLGLGAVYADNTIYDVKGGIYHRFGRDPSWWATLALAFVALAALEVGVRVVKAVARPSDTDVFQALEKDPAMRRRFEEASAAELQAGWNAAAGACPVELAADEAEREDEVAEMLRNRPASTLRDRAPPRDLVPTDRAAAAQARNSTAGVAESARAAEHAGPGRPAPAARSTSFDMLDLDYRRQAFARYREF